MRDWIAALCLAASACVAVPEREYRPTWRMDTVSVTWHVLDRRQLDELAVAVLPGCEPGKLLGYAVPSADHRRCEVFTEEPREGSRVTDADFGVLGHEIAHCFRGEWH
ncbi:MAG: hypothetical protein QJR02_11335 [Sinobacteraceae bacterium]|nr:hypothetical protein [Nevskiaceae bacterium]